MDHKSLRASALLRLGAVWKTPIILASIVVFFMTLVYFGSVVDPAAHLRGLPVLVVNQDRGASVSGRQINLGEQVVSGLEGTAAVTSRLQLTNLSWTQAKARMDHAGSYATLVVPANFTSSLLALTGADAASAQQPTIVAYTNVRLGTVGTSLATGVLQPAVHAASRSIGKKLQANTGSTNPRLVDPVSFATTTYRPLPQHAALGLSAFYIALLTLMCGFLGATIVNSSLDASLGYATTEVGPKWHQHRPMSITRWQTLLAKYGVAVVLTPVLTGLVVLGAVVILGMSAPDPFLLWLFMSFSAICVAAGTLALFSALGTPGQLVALLLFVYLALASSGGTVPLQALPEFFRFDSAFEPLRQILDGTRSLLYFNGQLDAGLGRSLVVIGIELVAWVAIGVVVTTWYDHKQLRRLSPEMLDYVNRSVDRYLALREGEQRPVEREPAASD